MEKTLPRTCLSAISFAKKCDYIFMRPQVKEMCLLENNIENITSNSIVYIWTEELNNFFNRIDKIHLENIILLTGDEDYSPNPNGSRVWQQQICPKKIIKWHAQNAEVQNNFMIPLPIGLCPPWAKGITNSEDLEKVIVNIQRNKLLYVNFSLWTNPHQRQQILNIITKNIGSSKNCTISVEFEVNKANNEEHYKNVQEHLFMLCPPGNGKDTHRMWEAIYLGAIPIVEDSLMNSFFSRYFPILLVDSWNDITEDFLIKKYFEFINKNYRYDLLDCDNWMKEHIYI